jgi:hypothetical protein
MLQKVCDTLGVQYHTVAKENHKAILTERFHRYLNKVQRIHAADCRTIDDWIVGTSLAVYGWNSAPVDGTDIVRSFAAMGREYPFPIDAKLEMRAETNNANEGEMVVAHIHGTFPLLQQQRAVLKILVGESRSYHRDLRNEGKKQPVFSVGDLVIIQKQVQTSVKHGPAKMQLRSRGQYRVLEQLSDNTYMVQRIPFDSDSNKVPGKPYKESAARMEKLPSRLVIHKHTDGTGTNWATYKNSFVPSPLEPTLGAINFGYYVKSQKRITLINLSTHCGNPLHQQNPRK